MNIGLIAIGAVGLVSLLFGATMAFSMRLTWPPTANGHTPVARMAFSILTGGAFIAVGLVLSVAASSTIGPLGIALAAAPVGGGIAFLRSVGDRPRW